MARLFTTLFLTAGVSLASQAGIPDKTDFSAFRHADINTPRITKTILPTERESHKSFDQLAKKVAQKKEVSRFAMDLNAVMQQQTGEGFIKMDSVMRVSAIDGTPFSCQKFTYNEFGQGLRSDNYVFDGIDWMPYSFFSYEYDDLHRTIVAESINDMEPYNNQRIEFIYSDDTPYYTTRIDYYPNWETYELEPYQKTDYQYDSEGRTTGETNFYWDSEVNDWVAFASKTATYDSQDRMTSFFTYTLDYATYELVGEEGHDYHYLEGSDLDKEVDAYIWEDGAWFKYEKRVLTYNDLIQLTKDEYLYWNRERQNWDGNDVYGMWGMEYNNNCQTFTYDELHRLILAESFRTNSDFELVKNGEDAYSYADLENGDTERTRIQSFMWEGPWISPYREEIQHFNINGNETYYKNYTFTPGYKQATDEEVRDITIENGISVYHGCFFYGFTQDEANKRYGADREEFGYADEESALNGEPSYGMHWKGVSYDTDTTWDDYTRDEFKWEHNNMVGNTHYVWENGSKWAQETWFVDVDWNQDRDRMWVWPVGVDLLAIAKVDSVEDFYDFDNTGWNPQYSTKDLYYYSDVVTTGVEQTETLGNAVETERYDISGRRVSGRQAGLNIVKYSDGTVRKVMMK